MPLPAWAEEIRHRYLRNEASLFVVHGNVHDVVLTDGQLVGVPELLAQTIQKKDTVIRYNVSTGCRIVKRGAKIDGLEELLLQRTPDKVLPILERILFGLSNVALIVEYAEMVA